MTKIHRAIPPLLLIAFASALRADPNPIGNPGFESVVDGKPVGWSCPAYWSGEVRSVAGTALVRGGHRAVELKTRMKSGRHWARIHSGLMPVAVGLRYRFSIFARGDGEARLGVISYLEKRDGRPPYLYAWQECPVALDDQWRQIEFEFSAPDADVVRMALAVELGGENRVALFDDADLQPCRVADGEVQVAPYLMVPVGQPVAVPVTVRRDGGPLAGGAVVVVRRSGDSTSRVALTLDARGQAICGVDAFVAPGVARLDFAQADVGRVGAVHVDAVDPAVYDRFRRAALEAKIGPCHLLFLGDSLTDFLRGQNYVDQIAFWLNEIGEETVTCRNAGVGGDTITRVWQRLNGDAGVHRASAYEGLYEPRPHRVFVMLGHNDSKLGSASGFTETYVSRGEFRALYGKVIGRLRHDTDARVTVLSSTSSVYQITRARAEASVAAGRSASLFGKPDVMEQFNALAREAAASGGADYLDIYGPTRDHPDKAGLFTADGVHMTIEGNHVVALEILRHLSRQAARGGRPRP